MKTAITPEELQTIMHKAQDAAGVLTSALWQAASDALDASVILKRTVEERDTAQAERNATADELLRLQNAIDEVTSEREKIREAYRIASDSRNACAEQRDRIMNAIGADDDDTVDGAVAIVVDMRAQLAALTGERDAAIAAHAETTRILEATREASRKGRASGAAALTIELVAAEWNGARLDAQCPGDMPEWQRASDVACHGIADFARRIEAACRPGAATPVRLTNTELTDAYGRTPSGGIICASPSDHIRDLRDVERASLVVNGLGGDAPATPAPLPLPECPVVDTTIDEWRTWRGDAMRSLVAWLYDCEMARRGREGGQR